MYDAARSVREDLSNTIYNIAPTDTPVINNAGRDKAKSTLFEWQTDGLAAASNTPVIEGDDVIGVTDVRGVTNRVNNYTQINRKLISVSGTLEAVDKAGMTSYLAYELSKASSEIKRDMELSVTGLQVGAVGTNAVARKSAGMGAWIITNYMTGGGAGAAPIMSGGGLNGTPSTAAVAGTPRAFTEALFKSAQGAVWDQGGDPKVAYMGSKQKGIFSSFAGIATRFRDVPAGKQATIVGAADVYIGDFGETVVVPDRFIPATVVYVGDPEYMSLAYLRPFQTTPLAPTGDAKKTMLINEWGLRMKSQYSWATIADLT